MSKQLPIFISGPSTFAVPPEGTVAAEAMELLRVRPDLAERLLRMAKATEKKRLQTPTEAYEILVPLLGGLDHERVAVIALAGGGCVGAAEVLPVGNDASCIVCARQVFRWALLKGARSIILAHNHPSGDPSPSTQDRDVTDRVSRAGSLLGLPLVDHMILGGLTYTSFAEQGLLPPFDPPT